VPVYLSLCFLSLCTSVFIPVFTVSLYQCIYPCVSCLSVPVYLSLCFLSLCTTVFIPVFPVSLCQFVLFCQVNQRFFLDPSLWFFPSPPGFDTCLSWRRTRLPDHSACPDPEPAYPLVLFGLWPGLWTLTCPWPAFCLPSFGIINIRAQPSASFVCIRVSPCAHKAFMFHMQKALFSCA
jgi:hypothetical protein